MVSQAPSTEPLRFSTARMRDPAGELHRLNERRAILPLEPVAGRAVHADIAW